MGIPRIAFVTGASGFVGSRLSDALAAAGWTVRAFDLRPRTDQPKAVEFIPGDVRDVEKLKTGMGGAEIVFHLASALGSSQIGPAEFSAINAGGTRAALEAARIDGVRRFVHFSSAGVLGHVKPGEIAAEGYPLDPRDVYDRTKLEGERIALEYAAGGFDVVVIRPGWVYGPGDRRTLKLIRAIARGRYIQAGKGETLQTPVFVDDLAAGTIVCAERGRRGEIYNLAGGEVFTVRRMTEMIAAAAGKQLPRFHLPMGPTRAAAGLMGAVFGWFGREAPLSPSRLAFFVHPKPLDISKARKELGFAPRTAFAEGMAQAIAWYRANGWI